METKRISQTALFDLHGEALLDYWEGDRAATTTLEFADRRVRRIPVDVYFRSPERLYSVERAALKNVRGKILVVGAGAGVHSLPLEQSGSQVCSLEISGAAVEVMRQRGVRDPRWEDFFSHRGSYDTILLLGRNIGIAGTLDGLPRLLRKCAELLVPGGVVITNSIPESPGAVDGTSNGYPGELRFRTLYKRRRSDWIGWLHVDYETLTEVAGRCGYVPSPILLEENGEFSALLEYSGA